MYTFVVTNMEDLRPDQVLQMLQMYYGRGRMEEFIKEGKAGCSHNWNDFSVHIDS